MKFKWTLFNKIQVLMISILIAFYVAVELIILLVVGPQLEDYFLEHVEHTTSLIQKNVEITFDDANHTLSYLKMDIELNNKDEDGIMNDLINIEGTHQSFLNVYIAYEDGSSIIWPEGTLPRDFDHRVREWYVLAFRNEGVKWSDTYVDVLTKEYVITGSLYVKERNKEAVIGMDISLEGLSNIINEAGISDNGVIMLLNSQNRIIACNSKELLNQDANILEEGKFDLAQFANNKWSTNNGLYYLKELEQIDMKVLVFIPKEDLVAITNKVQISINLILLLVLVVGIVTSGIMAKRMTRPMVKLKEIMTRSRDMKEIITFDGKTNDEIDVLIKAYNGLADHINSQNEEILNLAFRDKLTGLPNRINFERHVKERIPNAASIALFYMDIDNFKYINDTYGHDYGDKVLFEIGKRMVECCHPEYFMSRLSGDEFGFVIENQTDQLEIKVIANRILKKVNEPLRIEGLEFNVSASIGISLYPDDSIDFEGLLSNADIAMYAAKVKGKNHFVIFSEEIKSDFIKQINLETRLTQAMEREELFVAYQPLIDLETMKTCGMEALVRWTDAELGPIGPDIFIPIAERTLLINELGRFVLESAIKFSKSLYERYGVYYEINVNVSVVQLHLENYVEEVMETLNQYSFPARYLNLEITESVALESDEKIMMKLAYLRKKGVQISLDDFGTGYSSLVHLTDLSLSHMKIDRQLMLKAGQSTEVFQLMKSIVNFAHMMNYHVVAEGIEDHEMESMIIEMHADYAQGYLYTKPVVMEEFIAYLEDEKNRCRLK